MASGGGGTVQPDQPESRQPMPVNGLPCRAVAVPGGRSGYLVLALRLKSQIYIVALVIDKVHD